MVVFHSDGSTFFAIGGLIKGVKEVSSMKTLSISCSVSECSGEVFSQYSDFATISSGRNSIGSIMISLASSKIWDSQFNLYLFQSDLVTHFTECNIS